MNALENKAVGCLTGAAVGDAFGGATEGWTPAQIAERYGGWVSGPLPPYFPNWQEARPIAPYHKGDGHITDDTLMTHTLVNVYAAKRDHLCAHDIAELMVPMLLTEQRWVPELERETLLLHRVFLAEKWLVTRLHYAHADPREAGVGNIVNCGAAMYMAPVGIVNAANPDRAYDEAIDITGAHQWSFGREAAGVFAAATATAMTPGATVDDVIATALRLARDGTRAAIEAVCDRAAGCVIGPEGVTALRAAVTPFDTVGDDYRNPALDARRPSRTRAIEELPIALGMLVAAKGDYREAVIGAMNYGRDADSIATMAGAIAGALGGRSAVPDEWREYVARQSRIDIEAPARVVAAVASDVYEKDCRRHAEHTSAFAELAGEPSR